jgi:TPR repeat protein
MKHRARLALAALFIASATLAKAADSGIDFKRAAQLHRGGDTVAAMRIWQYWAERGDADAAYNLGIVLQHGDGTPRDPQQALRWFKLAAERGDKPAAYQAGLMLQTGDGVPADAAEAHRWFVLPRQHHAHHAHDPQMVAWRMQAHELIQKRDLQEALAQGGDRSAQIVADLRRRAGLAPASAAQLAAR